MDGRNYSGRTFKSFGRLSKKDVRSIKKEYQYDGETRHTKTSPIRLSDEEINLLIPIFDPVTTTGLSAAEWVASIENLRMIFDWDDRLTLLYASRRLDGEAKRWFGQNFCKWPQFKVNLQQVFCHTPNTAEIFEQLIRRSKNDGESYEKYAFDVERMAMKCGFDLETTINYMITGLGNSALRTHLVVCNCKTITEVLYRIQCFHATHTAEASKTNAGPAKSECGCKRKRPNPSEGAAKPSDQGSYRDLMTTVKVKEAYLTAFVSFDSDCTTMRLSELHRHDLKMKQCDEMVYVFDSGPVRAVGCLSELVAAGEVIMLTKVFIVGDCDQNHAMILGRNFLNSPNVCVFKTYRSLEIRYSSSVDDSKAAVKEAAGRVDAKEEDDGTEEKLLELLDFFEGDL